MDVVFIVGLSNSGKSTLVRSLTGKGNDRHNHPNVAANILELDWKFKGSILKEKTLVMSGSLNEGEQYNPTTKSFTDKGITSVHPDQLHQFLDDYQQKGAKRAILCISTTNTKSGWAVADYETAASLMQHTVTHCIDLNAEPSTSGHFSAPPNPPISGGSPRPTRNSIAAIIRDIIDIL